MVIIGVLLITSAAAFALGRYREGAWWRAAAVIAGAAYVQATVFLVVTFERWGYVRGDDFVIVTPAFLIMGALVYFAGRAMARD